MKRKWTDRQYNVQDNYDVLHKYVIMYCTKNKLPALPFGCTHSKTHDARGRSKHHQLCFDPELGIKSV